MVSIPKNYVEDIAAGKFLRELHTAIPQNYFGGNHYLRLVVGKLSLEKQEMIINSNSQDLLRECAKLSRTNAMWSMDLLLDHGFKLPPRDVPEFLIRGITSVSLPLYVQPAKYPIFEALMVVDSLYGAKPNIKKLQNRNKGNLELIAFETIDNFSQDLSFKIAQGFQRNFFNRSKNDEKIKPAIMVPNHGGGDN